MPEETEILKLKQKLVEAEDEDLDQNEDQVVPVLKKTRAPKTEAQLASFARAQKIRHENMKSRNTNKKVSIADANEKNLEPVITEKKPTSKKSAKPVIIEEESESDDEAQVIIVKKSKKPVKKRPKVVYQYEDDDDEDDEEVEVRKPVKRQVQKEKAKVKPAQKQEQKASTNFAHFFY